MVVPDRYYKSVKLEKVFYTHGHAGIFNLRHSQSNMVFFRDNGSYTLYVKVFC